jgi:hypothetical protein
MIKIFISSPYSLGDVAINVKRQIDVADELINLGFAPYVPLLSHFQHLMRPRSQEDWERLDLEWINQCDCLLRLDGNSKGADIEVEYAKNCEVPVFYDIDSIKKYYEV